MSYVSPTDSTEKIVRGLSNLGLLGTAVWIAMALFGNGWSPANLLQRVLYSKIAPYSLNPFFAQWKAGSVARAGLYLATAMALIWPVKLLDRNRHSTRTIVAWTTIGLGILLRLDAWWTKAFWCDTYSLKAGIVSHSFSELILGPLGFSQSAPVGFSMLSKAVGILSGGADRALTFPALLCGILTLFAADRCLVQTGLSRVRHWGDLLLAINPSLVAYSSEFKPYAVDALVATLFLLLLASAPEHPVPWRRAALLCLFAPFFSTTSFLVIPAFFLAATPWRRLFAKGRFDRSEWIPEAVCAVVALFSASLSFAHLVLTMPDMMTGYWADMFAPLPNVPGAPSWYAGRIARFFRGPVYFFYLPWTVSPIQILLAAIPVSVFWLGLNRLKATATAQFVPFLFLVLLVASLSGHWPICPGEILLQRFTLFLAVPATLVLAAGLDRIDARRRTIAIALLGCSILSSVLLFAKQSLPAWEAERNAHALRTMVSETPAVLLVDSLSHPLLVAYENDWLKTESSEVVLVAPNRTDDVMNAVAAAVQANRPVWCFFFTSHSPFFTPVRPFEDLLDCLSSRFHVTNRSDVYPTSFFSLVPITTTRRDN